MPFTHISIKNGPSLHSVFSQLHDVGRFNSHLDRPTVRFEIFDPTVMEDTERVDVCVNGIQAEDGSGLWWKLTGFVVSVGPRLLQPWFYSSEFECIDFSASYGLRMKDGEFHFEPVPK